MKPTIQILFFILLLTQATLADTLTVKQDSTGDYTIIQDALDAANTGDTVLVWPGTYFENLNFKGKDNITLAGTWLLNPVDSLISQTIVNGNQLNYCILLMAGETNCRISGLTITNGNGGIFISNFSRVIIENCEIRNNVLRISGGGGGIRILNSNVSLSGNRIFNNQTYSYGGGLLMANKSSVFFDTLNLNSIYLNHASLGYDILKTWRDTINHIILDTGTVINPNHYYLSSISNEFYQLDDMTYEVNHGKVEQVNTDLYVSPDGDNNNNGLSPEQALKNIAFAFSKIKSDSLHPNTIHLAAGTYAESETGEKLGLGFKSYVTVEGAGRSLSIIDAEDKSFLGTIGPGEFGMTLKNFGFKNGNGFNISGSFAGLRATETHILMLDSISFENCRTDWYTCVFTGYNDSIILKNCRFSNNTGYDIFETYSSLFHEDIVYVEFTNCTFNNNRYNHTDEGDELPGCIPIHIYTSARYNDDAGQINGLLINCLIANTYDSAYHPSLPAPFGLFCNGKTTFDVVNSTIADNYSFNPFGAPLGLVFNSNINIYNSIIYRNHPYQVFLAGEQSNTRDTLLVYNSCIKGGISGINDLGQYNFIHYDQTNIDTDPVFLGKWEHPYQIADGSPCIDAGTLNLPEFIELPEFDLAGNPRIVGNSIDMGAYEWNPTVGIDKYQYQPIKNEKPKLLHAAPNPFSHQTTISAQWDFTGHVQIEIYNNSGLRVKILKSGTSGRGSIQTRWDGKDANGNILPAGVYHVVMFWEGKEAEGMKVIKR